MSAAGDYPHLIDGGTYANLKTYWRMCAEIDRLRAELEEKQTLLHAITPPSDDARRIVCGVLIAHMRKGGLDVEEFRQRYLESVRSAQRLAAMPGTTVDAQTWDQRH